jgi:hypothetical protein
MYRNKPCLPFLDVLLGINRQRRKLRSELIEERSLIDDTAMLDISLFNHDQSKI